MLMQSGDRWLCSNAACRAELAVGLSKVIPGDYVRCACGGIMQKYPLPVFQYLDFLGSPESHHPQPEPQLHNARKE
jgi:hypothetical protein